jgi:hypothetical protein
VQNQGKRNSYFCMTFIHFAMLLWRKSLDKTAFDITVFCLINLQLLHFSSRCDDFDIRAEHVKLLMSLFWKCECRIFLQ